MKSRIPQPASSRGRSRSRLRRLSVCAPILALAIAAQTANAQDDPFAAKLDAPTRSAVLRTIEAARMRGLPLEPLVNKALEGAMKHAPGARIQAAVDSLLGRLEASRAALAPEPSGRDIAAGADALAYGVTRDALASVRAIRPRGSVAVPLAVLTQLVASGVPVSRATGVVAELIRRGARDEQLIALSDDVRLYIASGASPEIALDVRTRGLTAVLPPPGAAAVAADLLDAGLTNAGGPKRRP